MKYKPTSVHSIFLHEGQLVDGGLWNLCACCLFDDPWPTDAVNDALNRVLAGSDGLRMRVEDGELAFEPYRPRRFEVLRFEDEAALLNHARAVANRPVGDCDGLFTANIVEMDGRVGILNCGHHIMCDGLSVWALYQNVLDCLRGEPVAPHSYIPHLEAELHYEGSRRWEADRAFWNARLAGDPDRRLFPEVPAGGDFRAVQTSRALSVPEAEGLARACGEIGVSRAVFLYAAAGAWLSRTRGSERFCVGVPVMNRVTQADHRTLGLFMHIVPLALRVEDGPFADFAQTVQDGVFDLFRHQRFTAQDIRRSCLEGALAAEGLYDVTIDCTEAPEALGFTARTIYNDFSSVPMELHFLCDADGGVSLTLRCQRAVIDEGRVEALADGLMRVLRACVEDASLRLSALPAYPPEQVAAALRLSRGAEVPLECGETGVYGLFEAQARRLGDAVAVTGATESISYARLRAMAERVDAFLRAQTGSQKQVIGVLADRSPALLAAAYGIARGGNAYMPLSPEQPPARLQRLIEESGCGIVLAQRAHAGLAVGAFIIEDILEDDGLPIPEPAAALDDALYVIHTSGSTGRPKAAMVSVRAAVNRLQWMQRAYPLGEGSVVMFKTPCTFDVSLWEIFWWGLYGARVYILPPGEHYSHRAVLGHIRRGGVTDIHFVPSVFAGFTGFLSQTPGAPEALSTLRHIYLSGEALDASLVNRFRAVAPGGVRLHNLYGPAECAIDVTAYDCRGEEAAPLPIGRPIDNVEILILDRFLRPLPPGETGELCVGGLAVGMGYLNQPERTAERFVQHPDFGRLYRTGDLARLRPDGEIEFIGRMDEQVKLHGQRVEPGEVEAALRALAGVEQAVVTVDGRQGALIAWYTGAARTPRDLKQALARTLPRHMIPRAFIKLEAMPLNASGKADRRALEARIPPEIPEDASRRQPPESPLEAEICALFAQILGAQDVHRHSDFYALGGSSLDMMRLLSEPQLDGLTPAAFAADPTPAGIAAALTGKDGAAAGFECLRAIYVPQVARSACVLFPYAGGGAEAYAALASVFRSRGADMALYAVEWLPPERYDAAAEEVRALSQTLPVCFYSHCAGAVMALELIGRLNVGGRRVVRACAAGGLVPPASRSAAINLWRGLTDGQLIAALKRAGFRPEGLSDAQLAGIVANFRRDTAQYFDFAARRVAPVDCPTTVVLGSKDPFTRACHRVEKRWRRFAAPIARVVSFDCQTHYFQTALAERLADVIAALPLEV